MGFLPPEERSNTNKGVGKYIKFDVNRPVSFQILQKQAVVYWKYWLTDRDGRKVQYVPSSMDVDVISPRNAAIKASDPENWRRNPGYIRPQKNYAVNVLDVTPHVTCPECQTSYWPKAGLVCTCGKDLAGVAATPLNQVRILEQRETAFKAIAALDTGTPTEWDAEGNPTKWMPTVTNEDGTAKEIYEYVIRCNRTGDTPQTYTLTPTAMPQMPVVDIKEYADKLHPLPNVIPLTSDEVLSIIERTATLKEILAVRQGDTPDAEDSTLPGEDIEEVLW